jgi:long-chain acyl-CoA synthetase
VFLFFFLFIYQHQQITLVTFGWVGAVTKLMKGTPLRSVPVEKDESHRVDPRFKGALADCPRPGVTTLYEIAKDSFQRFGPVKCMGSRKFIGWKTPKIKEFDEGLDWITFAQMGVKAHKFGAALRANGCEPALKETSLEKVKTSCRMAIFENTCAEWMIAAMGAFTQAITVTTVYATLGADAVVEAVQDNLIPVIVCNKKDVAMLVAKCGSMKTLKCIVYTSDLVAAKDEIEIPTAPSGVTIISFEEFWASGDTKAYPPTPPKPETFAVVMYTSGSTGKPKGVIITHAQAVATCSSISDGFGIREGAEAYLAYLPLAHILELMAEFTLISKGCTLCYADPKSLSTTGAYPKGALEGTF